MIVRSPLFQLELKKKLLRREERLVEIQDNFLDGAVLGTKFHKDILEGSYPTETKMKSATVMSTLAARLLVGGGRPDSQREGVPQDGRSYEERLKEVTIRETVKTVMAPPPNQPLESGRESEVGDKEIEALLAESYPDYEEVDDLKEEDILFGSLEEETSESAYPKIENILGGV